jgi:hypothetical protein
MATSIKYFPIVFAMDKKKERFAARSREVFCLPIGRMFLFMCGCNTGQMVAYDFFGAMWKVFAVNYPIWRT